MPRLIRDTSSRSSISRTRCSTCRSMMSRARAAWDSSTSFIAQELHRGADRGERIAEFVRQHREELVLPPVCLLQRGGRRLQFGGPQRDPFLELAVQALQGAGLAVEVGEDTDLGAQNLRHDRHRHVVDRSGRVAAQQVRIRHQDRGDEDDRRLLESRVLPDHRRQLVPVEVRHAHIDQDDRDLVLQKVVQCRGRRVHRHQPFAELTENGLVGEELGGLVVDQQDVDAVGPRRCRHDRNPIGAATYGALRAAAPY